ncbi:MAG: hypothetical protein KJ732_07280 [Candidatus Margulisbacteria bacterium]|nr:hypothetical protein [Candidatus Margulisiibacteriota bacterium]
MVFGLGPLLSHIPVTPRFPVPTGSEEQPATPDLGEDGVVISPQVGNGAAPGVTPPAQDPPATPRTPAQQEYDLLCQIAPRNAHPNEGDYMEWRESVIGEDGKIDVNSSAFRSGLARLLSMDVDDVEDAPLDAIFGNQDGNLNGHDELTPEQFLGRLQIASRYFLTRGAQEGQDSFATFLQNRQIYFIDGSSLTSAPDSRFVLVLDHLLLTDSSPAGLSDFRNNMQAAGNAWIESAGQDPEVRDERERTVRRILGNIDEAESLADVFDGEDAEDANQLKELLFYAYMSRFEAHCRTSEIDIDNDIDWNNPQVINAFVNGIFTDFILRRENTVPQEGEIDHDFIMNYAQYDLPAPTPSATPGGGGAVPDVVNAAPAPESLPEPTPITVPPPGPRPNIPNAQYA